MKDSIENSLMLRLFTQLYKPIVFILALLVGSFMIDHGEPLNLSDVSPSGILSLEFANSKSSINIVESWEKESLPKGRDIVFWEKGKTNVSYISIAKTSIYLDFGFIILYCSVIYYLMYSTLTQWDNRFETFFGQTFDGEINRFLSKNKVKISLILVITIGFLDSVENILMLFKLSSSKAIYCNIFTSFKFLLLGLSAFFIFYTTVYWFLIVYLGKSDTLKNKITSILRNVGFIR